MRRMRDEAQERAAKVAPDEETRLLAACTGRLAHLEPILILVLNTGMRRGEILSLSWPQIDFTRNLIHLVRTKTGKARPVPMNSAVREQLLALRVHSRSQYVFTQPK